MVVSETLSINGLRYQDIAVVIAFIAAIFILKAPDVYDIKPAWRLDINGIYDNNLLPLPIISDLDNDGINELIVTTSHGTIKVLTFPSHDDAGHSVLPHLHTKLETSLRDGKDNASSTHQAVPVALSAGCLNVHAKTCYKSIVVVTSDWSVYLYNHYLELQWKKLCIFKHIKKNIHFREIAAFITPHGEGGLVIIGGRTGAKSLDKHTLSHNHEFNESVSKEQVEELTKKGFARSTLDSRKVSHDQDHFSTFAFSGDRGRLAWSHKPGDFEATHTTREVLLSSYHFKLALQPNQHHTGEEHWSKYHQSLMSVLPHRWHHPSDTKITTGYFIKTSTSITQSNKDERTWYDIHSPNIELFTTSNRRNNNKQAANHNAIVIHHQHGIEVLHMQSGRPLCRYDVTKEGVTVGDVNADGVIDQVKSRFQSREHSSHSLLCAAEVTSQSHVMFEGNICEGSSLFASLFDNEVDHGEERLAVPPVVVNSPSHRSGIVRHLLGHNLRRDRVGLDSVFLVSTGKVTSFGPHGELNWQVDIDGKWSNRDTTIAKYFPSMKPVSINVGQHQNALLITSWMYISLVSLVDGTVLSSHSLPCQPMTNVVMGDFTNDGLVDFVVVCSDSYLGFTLHRRIGYTWTIIWLVCGLMVIGMGLVIMRIFEELIL